MIAVLGPVDAVEEKRNAPPVITISKENTMVIKAISITKAVAEGTDEDILFYVDYSNGQKQIDLTPENVQRLLTGADKYADYLLYQGSKGVIDNLNNVLTQVDETSLRAILRKWRDAETAIWIVENTEGK